MASRVATTAGFFLADVTGVRGVDDFFHTHDAADGHVQSRLEQWADGAIGVIGVGGTIFGGVAAAKVAQTLGVKGTVTAGAAYARATVARVGTGARGIVDDVLRAGKNAGAPSPGASQAGLLTRTRRFFYDNRNFRREISPEYWAARGGAKGHSLHHWLIPQRAGIPQGIQNAGFNLINLPSMRGVFHASLDVNTWMGWARNWGPQHAARAARVENGIRIGIPLLGTGTAYVGYEVGGELWDLLNGTEGR